MNSQLNKGECEDYSTDYLASIAMGCWIYFDSHRIIIERVLFEQNKYMASDIEDAIEEDGYLKVIKENHKMFYSNCLGGYKFTTFELAIMHYCGTVEK